jgi:tRNA threonylcarbamoyl adenosine modification protein (Sua5/YciO/YrdC/YwlC family)
MSQFFTIHPENPQPRLIRQAAGIVKDGGVIACPTDSCYALGAAAGNKVGLERICRIRNLNPNHPFTLLCRDLSEATLYAVFDTPVYRLLKANTPGPYAFILRASREVPRRLMDTRRRTFGMRVPDHRIALALLEELDAPMITSSLILPEEHQPLTNPEEIRRRLEHQLDLIIDGGYCSAEPTTMVDLTGEEPRIIRVGKGDPAPFE